MFAELVDFASSGAGSTMAPRELVTTLGEVFSIWDEMVTSAGLTKIKNIGDSYMAVNGAPEAQPDHAESTLLCAVKMVAVVQAYARKTGKRLVARVGINSGKCVAGGALCCSNGLIGAWLSASSWHHFNVQ